MHALSFQLKRAHLRAVAKGREVLDDLGELEMTPARFDLLYLIRREAIETGSRRDPLTVSLPQSALVKYLGLHRSTVAKLVRRLVEMGWVRKERYEHDRRTWDVFLTKKGLARIWRAMKGVFGGRLMRRAYEKLYWPRTPTVAPVMDAVRQIARSVATARTIARHFGDRSWVWYDYGHAAENERLAFKIKC